ncbi:MAG TPA: M50 family metallopeptidase, partial [Streptosporangiaceae bacterium]
MPGDLWQHADRVWHHAFAAQPLPPQWLVVGSGALALAAVASARVWPITRTVVTIVHEGGHAMVALATGQRRVRVRFYRDTAGETVSASGAAGVGIA